MLPLRSNTIPILMTTLIAAIAAAAADRSQMDCQRNEVFIGCGSCEGTCKEPYIRNCSPRCGPSRCECETRRGFVRAHDGECIHVSECSTYRSMIRLRPRQLIGRAEKNSESRVPSFPPADSQPSGYQLPVDTRGNVQQPITTKSRPSNYQPYNYADEYQNGFSPKSTEAETTNPIRIGATTSIPTTASTSRGSPPSIAPPAYEYPNPTEAGYAQQVPPTADHHITPTMAVAYERESNVGPKAPPTTATYAPRPISRGEIESKLYMEPRLSAEGMPSGRPMAPGIPNGYGLIGAPAYAELPTELPQRSTAAPIAAPFSEYATTRHYQKREDTPKPPPK